MDFVLVDLLIMAAGFMLGWQLVDIVKYFFRRR